MEKPTQEQLKDWVEEQFLQGVSVRKLHRDLESREWTGILSDYQIEQISVRVGAVLSLKPSKLGKCLPRVVGVLAIVLGIGAIVVGQGGPHSGRYSPTRYGIFALILGVILVVRPGSRNFEI